VRLTAGRAPAYPPEMTDPIFAPTLQEEPGGGMPGRAARTPPPWQLGSQFWVAFLGGIPAVGGVAWLNSRRLGLPQRARSAIGALTLVTWAAWLGVAWALRTGALELSETSSRSWIRMSGRIAAVLLYLGLAAVQRKADRTWQAFGPGTYASLWKTGTVAVVLGWVLHLASLVALWSLTGGAR
jgi:hypothetical protein